MLPGPKHIGLGHDSPSPQGHQDACRVSLVLGNTSNALHERICTESPCTHASWKLGSRSLPEHMFLCVFLRNVFRNFLVSLIWIEHRIIFLRSSLINILKMILFRRKQQAPLVLVCGIIAFLSPGYPYITNLLDPIQEILYYFRSNSYFYFMERDGYRNKTENNTRMIIIFILNYKNISFLTYFSLYYLQHVKMSLLIFIC